MTPRGDVLADMLAGRWGLRIDGERRREIEQFVARAPSKALEDLAEAALGTLLIGETYFLRHRFYMQLVAERARRAAGLLRVLSAGCSTGEEAYSVAFAAGAAARAGGCRLEIVAFDVREAAVEHARRGVYSRWSLRALRADEQAALVEEEPSGSWRVRDEHRGPVEFRTHNLLDPLGAGPFDVVLACNATLYLAPAAAARAYALLRAEMAEDGLLMIAPTDPPPPPPFRILSAFSGWPVFGTSSAPAPRAPRSREDVVRTPRVSSRRAAPPSPLPRPTPATAPDESDPDEGLWAAWARGELRTVAERVRARVFQDPDAPLLRFLHAMILREQGQQARAGRELAAAAARLTPLPDEQRLAPAVSAGELRDLVRFWTARHG